MDQSEAPLLAALEEYKNWDHYGFTPPGHREGRGVDEKTLHAIGAEAFRSDVLMTGGLDDRKSSRGILKQAEELMAEAVGADQAFFSTCGSSLSIKAAMLAVAGGKGQLLVARDVHKSVVAGLVFAGLMPRWVSPSWDTERHIAHPPSPEAVDEGFARYPRAAGCLIVSPTPYGTCADIAGIAEVCHRHGKPLIVDEAWGAHLPFHEDLPRWAMDAGADVCVVSVHKMGAGFEQGSVFHLQGDLVDSYRLSACADLLGTTSTNVLILSAIDGWRRHMVGEGHRVLGDALDVARKLRREIDALPGFHVLEDELLGAESSHDLDRLQILMDISGLDVSGYDAGDWLREHEGLDLSLFDHDHIQAALSLADTPETADRLLASLGRLADAAPTLPRPKPVDFPSPHELELEPAMPPREAFFAEAELVDAQDAVGRIAAEQLTPYPPGIPVVVPGENINEAVVDYLRSGVEAGMVVPGAQDPSMQKIRVVAHTRLPWADQRAPRI
ncbi:aminotransferase class I/II-fold pyridoxal phosphate-dependent enzyme [Sinomonas humi]|uniref:aminotransferase class I/II-fold pyridoxal phosphate-dependent enzyme n=1 Tax=Sinomonas humi TaxID=1338436 RepID=UPI00068E86E4|nr:ornithine decarboxylase [Sinomonas humi]